MKKLFSLLVVALISVSAFAQSEEETFFVTPKVGFNIASITDVDNADPKFGLVVGAEAGYQMTEKLAFTGGLLYSMQGAKADAITGDVSCKYNYLNVPVLINYYVWKSLAIKAGFEVGFNLSAKDDDLDVKDNMKGTVFAIPVGASYEFNNFVVDARYNIGASKIFDTDVLDSKNSVFQFTLGYKFAL